MKRLLLFLCMAFAINVSAQTAKSRAALYTDIDTYFPSNVSGAITAEKLRLVTKNIVASAQNANTDGTALVSTASYSDPSWLTGVAWSKISGAPAFLTATHSDLVRNQNTTDATDASGTTGAIGSLGGLSIAKSGTFGGTVSAAPSNTSTTSYAFSATNALASNANTNATAYGLYATATNWSTSNVSALYGGFFKAENQSNSPTISYAVGLLGYANVVGQSAVTNLVGGWFTATLSGSGFSTATNLYGVRIDPSTTRTSSITNAYGLYIGNTAAATSAYSIYTGTGVVRFGDTSESTTADGLSGAVRSLGGASFAKNGRFGGIIAAGSNNTTLTDSTGKILSAALNTVAVANGGTGATDAATARTNLGVEPALGNPASDGYVLSSTAAGVRSWVAGGGSPSWGSLTGTLSNQTDLNSALSGKEPTISAGTTGQYWRGDKSWQTLDKTAVGLGSVENTALSTWAGTANITTLGNITTGTWSGTAIGDSKISSASTWNAKEPAVSSGTTGQYYRGDKSWQTLDKSAVALGSVENTALSTWAGTANVTTLGNITTGTWSGTAIGDAQISSASTWNAKEPGIAAGTTAQYWRGDKAWTTLDKTAVGLGSVENTAVSTWGGSTNIVTLGNVTTGTWSAGVVAGAYGGTGVANTGKTITLGGNFTTSGAFTSTMTMTDNTSVTLPTTGTLATLAGNEALTNKTYNGLTVSTSNGTLTIPNSATLATAGAYVTTLTSTANTSVTLPTTGTLATIAGAESLTNKKLGSLTSNGVVTTSGGDGTLSVATVAVANGGTGQTIYTNGQILIGNTTSGGLDKATLTQGSGMTITNAAGAITLAAAVTKTDVGLGSVENTALSTWAGTANITTVGTIGTGTWNGTISATAAYTGDLTAQPTNNGGWSVYRVSGSNATNTGQSLATITGLTSGTLSNSTLYEFEASMKVGTTATAGCKWGVTCAGSGTAATVNAILTVTASSTTGASDAINSIDTANTTAYLTSSGQDGYVLIRGFITTRGSGTATVSIQNLKVTSGTATTYIGSVFRIRKA